MRALLLLAVGFQVSVAAAQPMKPDLLPTEVKIQRAKTESLNNFVKLKCFGYEVFAPPPNTIAPARPEDVVKYMELPVRFNVTSKIDSVSFGAVYSNWGANSQHILVLPKPPADAQAGEVSIGYTDGIREAGKRKVKTANGFSQEVGVLRLFDKKCASAASALIEAYKDSDE